MIKNESITKSTKEISILKSKLKNKENHLRELNKNLNEFEANKNMLSNLEKHYEGYNRSVKSLMEIINKGKIANATGTKVLGEILQIGVCGKISKKSLDGVWIWIDSIVGESLGRIVGDCII